MLLFANSDQEVVWFDVSVQEMPRVDELYPLQHLVGQHEHRLEAELSLAVIEQVFE